MNMKKIIWIIALLGISFICTSHVATTPSPGPIQNVWKLNQLYADNSLVPDPTGKLYKLRYVFGENNVFLMSDSTNAGLMYYRTYQVQVPTAGSQATWAVDIKTYNQSQLIATYAITYLDNANLILTGKTIDGKMTLEYRFILDPKGGAYLNNVRSKS